MVDVEGIPRTVSEAYSLWLLKASITLALVKTLLRFQIKSIGTVNSTDHKRYL